MGEKKTFYNYGFICLKISSFLYLSYRKRSSLSFLCAQISPESLNSQILCSITHCSQIAEPFVHIVF